MAILSPLQIAQYARSAGFSGNGLVTIVAIALAESGGNTAATNTIGNSAGTDRGLYQINSYYHAEVTNACAFDPGCSSAAVYRISQSGSNFTPWSTYTGGQYRVYLAQAQNAVNSIGTSPSPPTTTTGISTVKPWYTFPRIDNLGGVEPFGGFPKPDSNIQIPANYPVTALLPGVVTALDGGEVAWGAVVTIKLDTPLNSLATHTAYLHLARSVVRVGQHVNAGDLIAYNGYASAAGAQKVPLGFALYNGDHYGFGPAWLLMTKANLQGPLSPVALLNSAANGSLNVPTGNTSDPGIATAVAALTNFVSLSDQVHSTLIDNEGFYGIALALDEAEKFPGLVDLTQAQPHIQVGGVDTGFAPPDVNGIIRSIAATVIDNALPLLIRGVLVISGFALFLALLIKPIGGVIRTVSPFVGE